MGTLKDSQQVCITVYFEGSYMNHSPKHVHTWQKGSFVKFTLLSDCTHTVFDWSMLKKEREGIVHFGRSYINLFQSLEESKSHFEKFTLLPHCAHIDCSSEKKEKVLWTLKYFKSICIDHWFSLIQIPLLTSDSSQFQENNLGTSCWISQT